MGRTRILILGGTTEARQLAGALADRPDLDVLMSLAGRTKEPATQGVATRIGGFGGSAGLAGFLAEEKIDLLIDATHPFAARISRNAAEAASLVRVSLFALRRPGWQPVEGDRWQSVADVEAAFAALPQEASRVFLAIGRQEAHHAETLPQHFYLVRSVDPIDPPLSLPRLVSVLAKGPFSLEDELALLRAHAIDIIIAKNSGGTATHSKLEAARALGIEVLMVERGEAADVPAVHTIEDAISRIDHFISVTMKRGV